MRIQTVRLGPFVSEALAGAALEGVERLYAKDGNVSVKGDPEEGADGLWYVNASVVIEEPDEEPEEDRPREQAAQIADEDPDDTDINAFYFHGLHSGAHGIPEEEMPEPNVPTLPTPDEIREDLSNNLYDATAGEERDDIAQTAQETVGDLSKEFENADSGNSADHAVMVSPQPAPDGAPSEEEEGDKGKGEDERGRQRREEEDLAMMNPPPHEAPVPSPAQSA
jgi:hypothetical protein